MRMSAMLSRACSPVLAAVAFAAACQDAPQVAPSGETRVEVTYDLTSLGDDDAVARFGQRYEAMLAHWQHLIALALSARVA